MKMKSHWLATVLFLAVCGGALAQTSTFSYQGRLNDSSGPASGIYDLRFQIFDALTNGNGVSGVLTNAATTVSNGLFTVALDFGAIIFDGADRWLEIAVRTNGNAAFATLSPRQQLTSTPYAINAAKAATASSVAAANISGTIPLAQLPTALVTNGANNLTLSGSFAGNGAGLSGVDIRNINSVGAITFKAIGNMSFALAGSPVVGSSPSSVIAVDVNGDGKADLISTSFGTNTIPVLTNDGSGGFALASSIDVGNAQNSITAADVNSDGKIDLIAAVSVQLAVLTNNGSGMFSVASFATLDSVAYFVQAADFNGDGKVDMAVANANANKVSVLTNDGSGGFVLASSMAVGAFPNSLAVADVNGDGKVDLISGNNQGSSLSVLTNDGSGGFVLASSPTVGTTPTAVAAADVNGDGKVDLISANLNSGNLSVLTNNGTGSFVLSSAPSVPASFWVTAADVNGDGKPDLISAGAGVSSLAVLLNDGVGNFSLASSPAVGATPDYIAAADLNGDGKVDLVSANRTSGTLSVLLNTTPFGMNFSGSGSGLIGLNATNIASGTLADARLSANVALLSGSQIFSGAKAFTNSGNSFSGNGAGLGSLNAANVSGGTLADGRLSANVATLAGNQTFSGAKAFTNAGNSFSGSGSGLTSLNAANLFNQVDDARLSPNVAFLNRTQVFSGANAWVGAGTNLFNAVVQMINPGNTLAGNGASIIAIDAGHITSGTLFDSILSANVPLLNHAQTFSSINVFSHPANSFSGNGSGLTSLDAGNVASGTLIDARLSPNVALRSAANSFSGNNSFTGSNSFSAANATLLTAVSIKMTTNNPIEFGLGVVGKDANAGKIGYQTFTTNALDIVGAGTNGSSRRIHFWNEGGANFEGSVGVGTNAPTEKLHVIGNILASGTITGSSDRNVKENFAPVDARAVLDKVAALPISRWNYKAESDVTHLGPMAQDFYSAFSVGMDDKHISMVDADGVALAAIQGLNQKLEQQKRENAELKKRLSQVEAMLNRLTTKKD